MPLVEDQHDKETPAETLAREARQRLAEFTSAALITYGNLMNYQNNNSLGVTKAEFTKAMGKEAKDFDYVLGGMKRLLLRLNPSLNPTLNEMRPKKKK